ncbi:unnamed protein product [Trichogramma brassicae]|uniref:Uncharacterized protein n=1 Tax=Trichogramma brassicae TaxID=86971 RepID=A0A6H5IQX5_9HYME|nr:unnamed protein product [Trichogramma brassicae]
MQVDSLSCSSITHTKSLCMEAPNSSRVTYAAAGGSFKPETGFAKSSIHAPRALDIKDAGWSSLWRLFLPFESQHHARSQRQDWTTPARLLSVPQRDVGRNHLKAT